MRTCFKKTKQKVIISSCFSHRCKDQRGGAPSQGHTARQWALSVSSLGLCSGGTCQLISPTLLATLAPHSSWPLPVQMVLCLSLRQNSFQNLSNFAPGASLRRAPGILVGSPCVRMTHFHCASSEPAPAMDNLAGSCSCLRRWPWLPMPPSPPATEVQCCSSSSSSSAISLCPPSSPALGKGNLPLFGPRLSMGT